MNRMNQGYGICSATASYKHHCYFLRCYWSPMHAIKVENPMPHHWITTGVWPYLDLMGYKESSCDHRDSAAVTSVHNASNQSMTRNPETS